MSKVVELTVETNSMRGPQGKQGEKGETGNGIEKIVFKEADSNGNNVYTIVMTNGDTFDFTANKGDQGERGLQGIQGETGEAGEDAYEAAKKGGYTGTEAQFYVQLATVFTCATQATNAASEASARAAEAAAHREATNTAKNAAVTAQGKAETAQGKAEEAQDGAETARDEAVAAKNTTVENKEAVDAALVEGSKIKAAVLQAAEDAGTFASNAAGSAEAAETAKSDAQASAKEAAEVVDSKAPLESPAFTGTPTAPTPAAGDDSTRIATTEFVENVKSASLGGLIFSLTEDGLVHVEQEV